MNFWQTMWSPIRSVFGRQQGSGTQDPGPGSYASPSAVLVTEDTARQLSAVWACVRLISQTVASLPIVVYRKGPNGREVVTDHWFPQMMASRPNSYQTRYEFWEQQIANLAMHGNLYAQKTELGGVIRALLPLNPLQVETKLVAGKVVHILTTDGKVTVFAAESVWHARMNGDLIVGRSPLQFGRNILGIAQAAEQVVSKIYSNGGKPSGVLTLDKLLTPEQRRMLSSNYSALTVGADDRLMVLEMGMKFDPVSMSPQDMELLSARKLQIDEIARWFGVPSVLINQNEGSTTLGSSTAEIINSFYKLNLRPYLEAIENSIVVNLFSKPDREEYEVEFDFEGLLRASEKDRYEGYRVGITSAVLTPNEARAREYLPPLPGGDVLMIQGAMMPITDAGRSPEPQPVG